VWIGDVERRRGGEDVAGDSVGGGWVGEVEAKMRSRNLGGNVYRDVRACFLAGGWPSWSLFARASREALLAICFLFFMAAMTDQC
jgi:hypothetical protein